jgi:hypothetical protein
MAGSRTLEAPTRSVGGMNEQRNKSACFNELLQSTKCLCVFVCIWGIGTFIVEEGLVSWLVVCLRTKRKDWNRKKKMDGRKTFVMFGMTTIKIGGGGQQIGALCS